MPSLNQLLDAAEKHAANCRLDDAIPLLEQALRKAPRSLRTLKAYGACLLATGQTEEALRCYKSAFEISPDDAAVNHDLALAHHATGDTGAALLAFENALTLEPNNPAIHEGIATVLSETGQIDRALRHMMIVAEMRPDDPDTLINLGSIFMRAGASFDACEQFRKAVAKDPENFDAKVSLCGALHELGNHDEALNLAEEIYLKRPRDIAALTTLANALLRTGDINGAMEHASEALKVLPELAPAVEVYAIACTYAGDPDKGIAHIATLLRQNPENPLLLATMAQALTRAGRHEDAIKMATAALPDPGIGPTAFMIVRHNLNLLGRFEEAVHLSHRIINGSSEHAASRLDEAGDGTAVATKADMAVEAHIAPSSPDTVLIPFETKPLETLVHARFLSDAYAAAGMQGDGKETAVSEQAMRPAIVAPDPILPALRRIVPEDRLRSLNTPDAFTEDHVTEFISAYALNGRMLTYTPERFCPYIRADSAYDDLWDSSLAPFPRPLIGICWSRFPPDIQLHSLYSMLKDMPGTLISLVWDDQRAELEGYKGVIDAGAHLKSLEALIDLTAKLDAVVANDSIPIHFAGGLGKPGIVLLTPDKPWYWHAPGGRSHWYPSLRVVERSWDQSWYGCEKDLQAAVKAAVKAAH